ncbi:MAG: hypothetical protein F4Y38_00355 [Gemmatimonadetes bacterium]|nr:hypothetical protein [Gemmatimonadota bacterium]MYG83945.1 hypothetical protein [Gemmatimonadota bacterium]MYJ91133.1 hypothetical protein [Gemmatimonadota bacterium]
MSELIVCGWDEVFVLEIGQTKDGTQRKVWSWKATDRNELPGYLRTRFGTTDECKPIDGGKRILITSSGGGAALIERETSSVVFYASVPNAHSADLLPGHRIAVAASHAPGGDRLIVYDLGTPDRELLSEELSWGHGVVWDETRQVLWALSDTKLWMYHLENWYTSNPSLATVKAINLPDVSGHDLIPVGDTAFLAVSTEKHCWLFDRDRMIFSPLPRLANEKDVKSISIHPDTDQLVYVRADPGEWWSETIRTLNPDSDLPFPGEHIYKARWNVV